MISKSKILGGVAALALLLSACSSSQSKDTTAPTTTTTIPANIVAAASKLTLKQLWKGNSVSVILVDSKGQDCRSLSGIKGEECFGFYIGWNANFRDEDRAVNYDDKTYSAVISNLQPGDSGDFQANYNESQDSEMYIVRQFPFAYNG